VTASGYFLEDRYFPWFITDSMPRPELWGRFSLESERATYYFCFVALLIVIYAARNLRRSRTGRAMIAVRDNEAAAETVTLNATRIKLLAFVISGALAGFAGGIYVVHQKGVFTGSYASGVSVALFSMVVIGGLGSLPGAILGAVYVRATQAFLPRGWALLASGSGILLLLMFLPEGLGGLLYGVRDSILRRVANRRGLVVPSLIADVRQDVGVELGLSLDAMRDDFELSPNGERVRPALEAGSGTSGSRGR
jgi:branched-chain amino acid transport system permease protein